MTERAPQQANADKKALFDLLLKKKGIIAPNETEIPQSANGGPLPLSFPQERIWSLYQLEPDSPAYHIRIARHITGHLDTTVLAQALERIACRHNILRSAFPEFEGRPNQLLIPNFTFPLTILDLQDQPKGKLEAAVAQTMTSFIRKPFDLTEGPLVRALVLQQAPETYILLIVLHQIIFDGASTGIFLNELTSLYEALSHEMEPELPQLSIQYADYTLWQKTHLHPAQLEGQRDYWRNLFDNPYQPLSLPTDQPRPPRESFAGSMFGFTVPAELNQALKQFSRQESVTMFATLLAGFNTLLALHSHQEDILVFTSAEGRSQSQLIPLIGLFSRQLPLRTDLSNRPTFRALVAMVNDVLKNAFANQDVAFSELVDMIQLAPGYSPAALFQAMFIYLSEPSTNLALNGLKMEPLATENKIAKFDWRLHLLDHGDSLTGWFEYKTELFSEGTIRQVTEQFNQLLTAAMENPDLALDKLLAATKITVDHADSPTSQAPIHQTYATPRDRAELIMNQVWEETFGFSPIGIHDDFFELGGHSLLAVRLFALVEEKTGRKLPLTTLFKAPTIAQLAELIRDDTWVKYESSLVPMKSDGSRRPYFFVPPAGTTVLQYAALVPLLDKEQPFYGLQSLGLESGETPHTTVEEMATYYLRDIQAFQPEGPYYIGGQCFGGLVAFEMARQLKAQGQEVALLAIIDTEIPPRKGGKLSTNGHQKTPFSANALRFFKLPWKTYVFFRKTYKRTRATRMWAHKNPIYLWQNMAIWRRYANTLQAHLDARLTYVVTDPYPGKISLLKFSTSHHEQKDGLWLWDDLASDGIDVQVIPADTDSRINGLFSKQLGKWLEQHLKEAQTE